MTLILDMASGTEYQGEELSCPNRPADKVTPANEYEHTQLQLAVVETSSQSEQTRQPESFFAGIDIESLLKDI